MVSPREDEEAPTTSKNVYKRKKPNYFPEEPTEPHFPHTVQRTPRQVAWIWCSSITFVVLVGLYAVYSVFIYNYAYPKPPIFKLVSLNVSSFNIIPYNSKEFPNTLKSSYVVDIRFSVQKGNKMDIHFHMGLLAIGYQAIGRIAGYADLPADLFKFTDRKMFVQTRLKSEIDGYPFGDYSLGEKIREEWSRGEIKFLVQIYSSAVYTSFWAPVGTKTQYFTIQCDNLTIKFSSPRSSSGTLLGENLCTTKYFGKDAEKRSSAFRFTIG